MSNNDEDVEDEDLYCPLCTEEMDLTDRTFKPCKCGYKMCLWCWHNIMENVGAKCPACRAPYDQSIKAPDQSIINSAKEIEINKRKTAKSNLVLMNAAPPVTNVSSGDRSLTGISGITLERQSLLNVRVMQRNLVYAIGLAPSIAKEDILREKNYFGKFGKIFKIAVNKKQVHGDSSTRSFSAYITYKNQADALDAIRALDGTIIADRQVRCTFGTTKYCSMFLRHATCTNPTCLYLHEIAKDSDYIIAPDETAMSAVERFTQQNDAIFAEEISRNKANALKKAVVPVTPSAPAASSISQVEEETHIITDDDEDDERLQQEDNDWEEVYENAKPQPSLIISSSIVSNPAPLPINDAFAFPSLSRNKSDVTACNNSVPSVMNVSQPSNNFSSNLKVDDLKSVYYFIITILILGFKSSGVIIFWIW